MMGHKVCFYGKIWLIVPKYLCHPFVPVSVALTKFVSFYLLSWVTNPLKKRLNSYREEFASSIEKGAKN